MVDFDATGAVARARHAGDFAQAGRSSDQREDLALLPRRLRSCRAGIRADRCRARSAGQCDGRVPLDDGEPQHHHHEAVDAARLDFPAADFPDWFFRSELQRAAVRFEVALLRRDRGMYSAADRDVLMVSPQRLALIAPTNSTIN